MNTRSEKVINKIANNLSDKFGKRILNLVLFGSQLRDKDANDIDLHLLLDKKEVSDLLSLRDSLPNTRLKVDILVSYRKELDSSNVFRIRSQGRYFLNSLAEGKLLIGGSNFYKRLLLKQNHDLITRDLLVKNKEYQNSLRDFLLEKDLIKKQKKVAKYLLRYINQTLLVLGAISYKEIFRLNKKQLFSRIKTSGLLNNHDLTLLDNLSSESEKDIKRVVLNTTRLLYKLDDVNEMCFRDDYEY